MDWQTILMIVGPLGAFLAWIYSRIDKKFDKIDDQFDKIDERFDKVYERFDRLDQRIQSLDSRVSRIEGQLAGTYHWEPKVIEKGKE